MPCLSSAASRAASRQGRLSGIAQGRVQRIRVQERARGGMGGNVRSCRGSVKKRRGFWGAARAIRAIAAASAPPPPPAVVTPHLQRSGGYRSERSHAAVGTGNAVRTGHPSGLAHNGTAASVLPFAPSMLGRGQVVHRVVREDCLGVRPPAFCRLRDLMRAGPCMRAVHEGRAGRTRWTGRQGAVVVQRCIYILTSLRASHHRHACLRTPEVGTLPETHACMAFMHPPVRYAGSGF